MKTYNANNVCYWYYYCGSFLNILYWILYCAKAQLLMNEFIHLFIGLHYTKYQKSHNEAVDWDIRDQMTAQ